MAFLGNQLEALEGLLYVHSSSCSFSGSLFYQCKERVFISYKKGALRNENLINCEVSFTDFSNCFDFFRPLSLAGRRYYDKMMQVRMVWCRSLDGLMQAWMFWCRSLDVLMQVCGWCHAVPRTVRCRSSDVKWKLCWGKPFGKKSILSAECVGNNLSTHKFSFPPVQPYSDITGWGRRMAPWVDAESYGGRRWLIKGLCVQA